MDSYYIITFENTHGAISGESALKENKIKNTIMPTPTFITKSCGLSIRISNEEIEKVKELILKDTFKIKEVFSKSADGYRKVEL